MTLGGLTCCYKCQSYLQHLPQEIHLNNYSVVFKMKKKRKERKGRRRDRKRVKIILRELHKISWRFLDIQQIIDLKIPISMYIGDLQQDQRREILPPK